MNYPKTVSFTITNVCNLRCKMCGQWSAEGYMHNKKMKSKQQMQLQDWKRLIDELEEHNIQFVLLRGGEPFLFPSIIELLQYLVKKGIFVSIDTNGTLLYKYAEQIVALEKIHLTISVDGPKEIHDEVRGMKGTFTKIEEGLKELRKWEAKKKVDISKSMTFTISQFNYRYLGEMPEVARQLKIKTINIIPYLYVPCKFGEQYEKELKEKLGHKAFSWKGFHHEGSGIDFEEFKIQYNKYLNSLKEIHDFPYLPLSEEEYKIWFENYITPVGNRSCTNIEKLIDIQPTGDANFCIDTPDYSFGNAKETSIDELWNNEKANAFRKYRRGKQLIICYRCVAKYMSEIET